MTRTTRTLLALLATSTALAAPTHAAEFKTVDPAQSRIGFAYTQMGVGMDGSFGKFTAKLAFDPARPEQGKAALELQIASIDAGSSEANDEVKAKDWFNTAAFPTARFESGAIKPLGANRYQLNGKLTIKGRTHDITTPVSFTPSGKSGSFDGVFAIKRSDYGIGEGQWADVGIVADEIRIKFHIVAGQ